MLISESQFQNHFEALMRTGMNLTINPLEQICPICMRPFSEVSEMTRATKEDAPPASLGGSRIALTCKKCNSSCGQNADIHVVNFIKRIDQRQFVEGSNRRVKINNQIIPVNAELIVGKDKELLLNVSKTNNDRRQIDNVLSLWKENAILDFQNSKLKLELSNLNSGILKTAYILLYSHIGYSLFNWREYDSIRAQIQSPEKSIIPPLWTCQDISVPDGIYIHNEVWLRGFFVVFTLKDKNTLVSHKVIVLMPAPQTDMRIAHFFLTRIEPGDRLSLINITKIDYLDNSNNIVQLNKWANGQSLKAFIDA